MSILVLTGTTGFPLLEEHMWHLAKDHCDLEVIIQSGNPFDGCSNVKHRSHIDMDAYDTTDTQTVIGHCGAGTVFWALERKLPLIAVVDMTRPDGHQEDLGRWLETNNFCLVLMSRGPTIRELEDVNAREFSVYHPDQFEMGRIEQLLA